MVEEALYTWHLKAATTFIQTLGWGRFVSLSRAFEALELELSYQSAPQDPGIAAIHHAHVMLENLPPPYRPYNEVGVVLLSPIVKAQELVYSLKVCPGQEFNPGCSQQ